VPKDEFGNEKAQITFEGGRRLMNYTELVLKIEDCTC
jgi:hypothetical protein